MYSDEDTLAGGLPHSEIPGSTIARISPGLFAACHVLHRLSVPRHPPDALTLRLSATPNGKDHVRWNQRLHRRARKASRREGRNSTFRQKRQDPSSPDLVIGAADSPSPGGTTVPPLRRHFVAAIRPARLPGALGVALQHLSRPAKPRFAGYRYGHTTHFFTIVNQRHLSPLRSRSRQRQSRILLPRRLAAPLTRRGPSQGGPPEVEVIGIEPTTPCLQSRCSPS